MDSFEEKEFLGSRETFAILHFQREDLRMMVPRKSLPDTVRNPIKAGVAEKVLEHLESWDGALSGNWKTRNRKNQQRLESGDPFELSQVYKGLLALQEKKGRLNSSDRRQLHLSLDLLTEELAVALKATPEAARQWIAERCGEEEADAA